MSSIIERIRNNDPDLKDLRLTEDIVAYAKNTSELSEALGCNSVIEYVRLDRDFLPSMPEEDSSTFFRALGKLPNLKEALIWHASISIKVFTEFLELAIGLEKLQLGCIDLQGTADDFQAVSDAIKDHPNLAAFLLSDFSLNDDKVSIDNLIEVLSTLPKLQRAKLEVTYAKRSSLVGAADAAKQVNVTLSGKALARLCTSETLEELYLSRLHLTTNDVRELAESIKSSPALKTISLPHCGLDDDACSALAVAFRETKILESVDLSCNKFTDEGCIAIATALKGNESIKFLRLWGNVKISNAGFDALADMLEHNCHLERVPLMAPREYKDKIDSKLLSNRRITANQAA